MKWRSSKKQQTTDNHSNKQKISCASTASLFAAAQLHSLSQHLPMHTLVMHRVI